MKAEMSNTEGNTIWAPRKTRRILKHACIGRLAIVALSARPPGVNQLCVCVKKMNCAYISFEIKNGVISRRTSPLEREISWLRPLRQPFLSITLPPPKKKKRVRDILPSKT